MSKSKSTERHVELDLQRCDEGSSGMLSSRGIHAHVNMKQNDLNSLSSETKTASACTVLNSFDSKIFAFSP